MELEEYLGTELFENLWCEGENRLLFDCVYWNFPDPGAVRGFPASHPIVNWRARNMMRKFLRSVRPFLREGSIVKISTNTQSGPIDIDDVIACALNDGFAQQPSTSFHKWAFANYNRVFGDDRDNLELEQPGPREKDIIYVFQFTGGADSDATDLPDLDLEALPMTSSLLDETAYCSCGFLCPREDVPEHQAVGHFSAEDGAHLEITDHTKLERLEEFVIDFQGFC